MNDHNAERVALVFLEQFWADREAGEKKTLCSYLNQHPGHEELIAAEYLAALEQLRAEAGESTNVRGEENCLGPYRLMKELGRGGQGIVWLAEDSRLNNRKVALKVLTGLGPGAEGQLARFKREAMLASKLEHQGICGVHDTGIEGGVPYIAMRYIDGESLADRLSRLRNEQPDGGETSFMSLYDEEGPKLSSGSVEKSATKTIGRAELNRVVHIFEKVALALHAAHEQGIIHRDIKPGNIMLTLEDEPVILDFGLAHDDSENSGPSLTMTGDLFGTPAYMSPEQVAGQRVRLDRRSDIYSLGVTLYELISMKRPFEAPTREGLYQAIMTKEAPSARKLNKHIPADLEIVLQCALEKDRDRRYQTAADLAEDLRRVREGEPILARKVSVMGRAIRWSKRRPAMATLVAVLTIGLPVTSALGVWFWTHRGDVERQKRASLERALEAKLDEGYFEFCFGDAGRASTAFRAALALRPESAEGAAGLAMTMYRLGETEGALRLVTRTEGLLEEPALLSGVKAQILTALGRKSEAVVAQEQAAGADGPLASFLAGLLELGKEKIQGRPVTEARRAALARADELLSRAVVASSRARRAFHFALAAARGFGESAERAVQVADAIEWLWPESSEAWKASAGATRFFDLERTESSCREALRLMSDDFQMLANFGSVLAARGKLDEAVEVTRRAIALNPDFAMAHANLGQALLGKGDKMGAIDALREAVRLEPGFATFRGNLGACLMEAGKLDEAIAAFSESLLIDPTGVDACVGLGVALLRTGDFPGAISHLREAIRLNPHHHFAYVTLAPVLNNLGRLDEAIELCDQGLAGNPELAHLHYCIGWARNKQGKAFLAIKSLREAVRIDPAHKLATDLLAALLARAPDLKKLRSMVLANPEDARALNSLAWTLVDPAGDPVLHHPEEALPVARRAVQLTARGDAMILDTLAVTLSALKQYDEAITVQKEVLRLLSVKAVEGMSVAEAEAALARYRKALVDAKKEER